MNSADGAEPLLRLEDVVLAANGTHPAREFTVDVAAGEALGVLGPRGSGKTALLDVVSGFLRPRRGRIVLGGAEITGWTARRIARAGVARTFQTPAFLDGTMIHDTVMAAAIGRGLPSRQARAVVRRELALAGLEAKMYLTSTALNSVEQRLLTLARVAAAVPRLALLDEPLAGLEPAGAGRILSGLRRLRSLGITLVVTAHDGASLRVLCDQAVLMGDGRIVAAGRPAEVRGA